jgi:hypothetical protein
MVVLSDFVRVMQDQGRLVLKASGLNLFGHFSKAVLSSQSMQSWIFTLRPVADHCFGCSDLFAGLSLDSLRHDTLHKLSEVFEAFWAPLAVNSGIPFDERSQVGSTAS